MDDHSTPYGIQEAHVSTAAPDSIDAAALVHAQTHLKRSAISHYHIRATDQTLSLIHI